MFDEGDADGMLTEEELIAGLKSIKMNVTQQLKRLLMGIFDADQNGIVSKTEFFEKVSKYTKKEQIKTEDITGDLYTAKDKEDIVVMVNEERREKKVFEDFAFDEEDLDVRERRKQQIA
jgi:hypothetical protein